MTMWPSINPVTLYTLELAMLKGLLVCARACGRSAGGALPTTSPNADTMVGARIDMIILVARSFCGVVSRESILFGNAQVMGALQRASPSTDWELISIRSLLTYAEVVRWCEAQVSRSVPVRQLASRYHM